MTYPYLEAASARFLEHIGVECEDEAMYVPFATFTDDGEVGQCAVVEEGAESLAKCLLCKLVRHLSSVRLSCCRRGCR